MLEHKIDEKSSQLEQKKNDLIELRSRHQLKMNEETKMAAEIDKRRECESQMAEPSCHRPGSSLDSDPRRGVFTGTRARWPRSSSA